jgi:hypothetical protein
MSAQGSCLLNYGLTQLTYLPCKLLLYLQEGTINGYEDCYIMHPCQYTTQYAEGLFVIAI